jgi:hypothetical protein
MNICVATSRATGSPARYDGVKMNRAGIITAQLDRELAKKLRAFGERMAAELGREVPESEIIRVVLRRGLGSVVSFTDGAYMEGWKSGAAAAREAFERGVAGVSKKMRSLRQPASST